MENMLNYEKRISAISACFYDWIKHIFIRISPLKCQALSQTNLYMLEWLPNKFIWYK